MNKLNFGCGSIQPDGWENVDSDPLLSSRQSSTGEGQEVWRVDVLDGGFSCFEDGHFDLIVAHHSLQQIPWPRMRDALLELRRVLRPGGWLRVSIPDVVGAMQAFERRDLSWFPNSEPTIAETFCTYLTWYGTNVTPMTASMISARLFDARFGMVRYVAGRILRSADAPPELYELDAREPESLFVEARG